MPDILKPSLIPLVPGSMFMAMIFLTSWWPLYKGTTVQGTVYQGDFGPRRLLSKEVFTSDKLAQIIFFLFSIGYYDIDWS